MGPGEVAYKVAGERDLCEYRQREGGKEGGRRDAKQRISKENRSIRNGRQWSWDGLRGGRAAAISLPFWLNGKEGNIRGGGGVEENDDCDYGRPARQKKTCREEMSVDAPVRVGFVLS